MIQSGSAIKIEKKNTIYNEKATNNNFKEIIKSNNIINYIAVVVCYRKTRKMINSH